MTLTSSASGSALRVLAVTLAFAGSVMAATPAGPVKPLRINATPGTTVTVDTVVAACVQITSPPKSGEAKIQSPAGSTAYEITYTAPAQQRDDVTIAVTASSAKGTAPDTCDPAGSFTKQYLLVFGDGTPAVSNEALTKSFQVLASAFVVALLLENAFALLFGWRLFIVYFSGKAWRTPIMFAASLAVVRAFDIDLMATLFNAYQSSPSAPVTGGWLTSILTAMILAGGSGGVNRIMVALGFRSQLRSEDLGPDLKPTEAWISIKVSRAGVALKAPEAEVQITEVQIANGDIIPVTYGVLSGRKSSLKGLFFRDPARVPPVGGITVSTEKYYRLTLLDVTSKKLHDVDGRDIPALADATVRRFGPRAIIDFYVVLS